MGKICHINGQPYLASLPLGGKDKNDRKNQWDEMINFLGEDSNSLFHWSEMFSWCQDDVNLVSRVVRGYTSAHYWEFRHYINRLVDVGFRPVLTPLDPETMQPDSTLLDDIPDGTKIALTSLYMGGKVIAEPRNPTVAGDVMAYRSGAEITLSNRDKNPKNWLHVIKFKDSLWLDRNILKRISWEELKMQGFTGRN